MREPAPWLYLWSFVASFAAALILTPLAARVATRAAIADEPGGHKRHAQPVALLGGLAIYAAAIGAAWALAPLAREELKGFALAGLVMAVFGLQDDIAPLDPWLKLLGEATAALTLVGFGVGIALTGVVAIDIALTVVWVLGVVNAFNYQDNMDGLAAGLAVASALGFFVLAITADQYLVALLSVVVAGAALGFLPSNYPRARIYMGDCGSLFVGFVLAFLGIRLRFLDEPHARTVLLPVLVLAVPLFDLALVTFLRWRRGVSVLQGGTDHTSHRLVRLGLEQRFAVVALWLAQGAACVAAVVVAHSAPAIVAVALVAVAFTAVAAFVGLARGSWSRVGSVTHLDLADSSDP